MLHLANSEQLFNQAKHCIPGGVNSPVRAFQGVGGYPPFIAKACGAYLFDVDGNRYIDYVGSWGPMILGHAHSSVLAAVRRAVKHGLSFGAPTEVEVQMAQTICELMPSIESVRMVNSGTEATMSAIRLARGYTGRDKIIKFNGCYHGHADALLVKAGSGALTCGIPGSAGVPSDIAQHTLVAEFNCLDSVADLFKAYPNEIAALIVEPVAGNMNCIPPLPEFLPGLRQLCDQYGSLLIFDEVMTGFRIALGGAQAYYQVTPDLTTLGKIIGGGMPVGAFGGKREIMRLLAPEGPVYQAGTLSGNPIAMAAGLANLNAITARPDFYDELANKTTLFLQGLRDLAQQAGVPLQTQHVGSMFGLFFTEQPSISTYSQVQQCNLQHFTSFFHGMLERGVYLAPSAFEAGFMSAAHGQHDIEATWQAAEAVFHQLARIQ